jgi:hypothetical protein
MMRSTNTIVFECKSKACAPPPVGKGGSIGKGGSQRTFDDAVDAMNSVSGRILSISNRRGEGVTESTFAAADQWISYCAIGYEKINSQLRQGDASSDRVRNMDRAFGLFGIRMTKSVTVTRAMTVDTPLDLEVGQVIEDKAYVSTSLSSVEAKKFMHVSDYDSSVMFKIKVPAGVRMLPGMIRHEQELILPRGTKFEVTGKRMSTHRKLPVTVYDVKVLT